MFIDVDVQLARLTNVVQNYERAFRNKVMRYIVGMSQTYSAAVPLQIETLNLRGDTKPATTENSFGYDYKVITNQEPRRAGRKARRRSQGVKIVGFALSLPVPLTFSVDWLQITSRA